MQLAIYTDGGSAGNPGPAAYAFVVYQGDRLIFSKSETIGKTTNNIAEYTGLIKALEWVRNFLITHNLYLITNILFYSDSRLMINQLNGYFKVKNALIREYIFKIRGLENQMNIPIAYYHILRQENQLADSLVKKALMSA